ncbi:MAG: hypothetical protein GY810_15835 [Aureispira sp.]|nr:hypothetical protein [Aureispira sp.]
MEHLKKGTVESSEFVEATFNFWFIDNQHIRSPFPAYMQDKLKGESVNRFYAWVAQLEDEAKKEVNDDIVTEKFEEIIFEEALKLAMTEDDRITICYPFLPRLGDQVNDETNAQKHNSKITHRAITKEKDETFMKVKLKSESDFAWETKFELPL